MKTHVRSALENSLTLTFDLSIMNVDGLPCSMSTDFGVDSSSCIPFRVQTDRQARLQMPLITLSTTDTGN